MDDTSIILPPLPDDPAQLKRMVRQQQAGILAVLAQRDRHGARVAELEQRCGELEHQKDELLEARDRRIRELEQAGRQLRQKQAELELDKLRLEHQLEMYKKRCYGPRADKVELGQLLLDFACALEKRPVNPQDLPPGTPAQQIPTVRRVRSGRRNLALFTKLPVMEKLLDLNLDQKTCPDGHALKKIGEEVSWQIEYAPGFFYRLKIVRSKYACGECEQDGHNPHITVADKPSGPIDKGMAGPGLLAHVITSKFADFLPLYRLEAIYGRNGFEIDRATMSVWAGDVADLVTPLYDLMARRVRQSHVIGTDDTILPMLAAGKTKPARIWVYRGDGAHPHNVFDFTLSRGRDGPSLFLGKYNQTLLADAYGGYDGVVVGNGITRAGCWAHGRRKFVDCQKLAPEVTHPALALMGELFAIEATIKGRTAQERLAVRQHKSVPVLEELHQRLLGWKLQLLPKHPVAQAVGYILNQWEPLNVFAADGAVDIDNNIVEQQMKRIAMGRKAFLFVGNERGGRTAAILSSLTSTCQRHGIDPQLYLTQLLVNLPDTPISQLDQWLPDVWKRRQPADLFPPRPPAALVWPASPVVLSPATT